MNSLNTLLSKIYKNPYMPLFAASAFFLFFTLIMPDWYYNAAGWVDGWAYTGFFMDFPQMRSAIANHPAGDLLPLIFPGWIIYEIFNPFLGNIIFKFVRFIFAGYFIFRALEIEFSRRSALVGMVLFLTSFPFLEAARTDYTDGMVIFYISAALFCAAKAYIPSAKKALWLVLCGACFAGSVFSAFLSAVLGAGMAFFILYKENNNAVKVKNILKSAVLISVGFFAAVGLFAFIYFLLGFDVCFFINTVNKAKMFMGTARSSLTFFQSIFLPAGRLFAVGIICSVFMIFVLKMQKKLNRKNITPVIAFLISFVLYALLQQFKNQETISNIYYLNHLFPFMIFSVSAIVFSPYLNAFKRRNFVLLIMVLVYLGIMPYIAIACIDIKHFLYTDIILIFLPAAAVLVFMLREKGIIFISLFIMLYCSQGFSEYFAGKVQNKKYYHEDVISLPVYQRSVIAWVDYVKKNDPQRKGYIWYNARENYLYRGFSAASHLWQRRLFNEEMPDLDGIVIGGKRSALEKIETLFIISPSSQKASEAISVLKNNTDYEIEASETIMLFSERNITFFVTKCIINKNNIDKNI